jgi:alpha-tubulin suppressor-like RCC1 family protein
VSRFGLLRSSPLRAGEVRLRARLRASLGFGTACAFLLTMMLGAGPGATASAAAPAAPAAAPELSWGDNSAGELCNGTLTGRESPAGVPSLSGVRALAAGGRHVLALLSNGTVRACGDDTFGQLGNGAASANGTSELFAAVPRLPKVIGVAAGAEHSLALLANGTVMAWGDGREGQLGDGGTASSTVPVAVKGLTRVKAIAAGNLFSLALLTNGTVLAWGDNRSGALGNGTEINSDVPVPVKGLTGVTAIAGGGFYALALLANGTVRSWGDNESDQLGDGQDVSVQPVSTVPVRVVNLSHVRAVSAGFSHADALLANGTVMDWGDNGFFELARPQGFPGGIADSDVPLTVPGLPTASAIAAGGLFSLAVVAGGKVDGWGDDSFGQLGNGTDATGQAVVHATGVSGVTTVVAGDDAAMALRATPSGAARTAVAGPASTPWRVVGSPVDPAPGDGLTDVEFSAVSAVRASDAWAVGASSALFDGLPLAEHWDGHAWHNVRVPLPAGASTGSLSGVLELSSANAWAVGAIGAPSGTGNLTLIEHWNGHAWSVVPSPNPVTGIGNTDELFGIAGTSATDLWAVGFFGTDIFNAMLFEHWNGKAWSFVPPPTTSGDIFGEAITAITPGDAWAVGDTEGGTISAHWNGKAWSFVNTPFPQDGPSPTNHLTGVTATGPDNVWASGYEGNVDDQNFSSPYVLHWNGKAWSLIKVPDAGSEGSLLLGITALSATDIWASGQTGEDDGGLLSLTERFNGKTWSLVPSLDPGELPPGIDNTFDAVAGVPPHTLFAVGTQETPTTCCLLALAEGTAQG